MSTGNPASNISRRGFLRNGLRAGVLGLGGVSAQLVHVPVAGAQCGGGGGRFGPLQAADANGIRLPNGFSSRVVAFSGTQPVASSSYTWPQRPDGGAAFATGDGGWVYVANSELSSPSGGVGALRFQSDGTVVDAYSILTGTQRNCAGGPTPWGTWLSCEENVNGHVWECDPFTPFSQGIERAALGTFRHEAAAVDPIHEHVYLTEDASDGLLYRFTPTSYPDLSAGALETAEILDPQAQGPIQPGQQRPLAWHAVAEPNPPAGGAVDSARQSLLQSQPMGEQDAEMLDLLAQDPNYDPSDERATRFQASGSSLPTPFNRGEGCWYEAGSLYFGTTGDNRVWRIDTAAQTIEILYDLATTSNPVLSGVDNVYASPTGDVFVAEDGGDMQVVVLSASGEIEPVVEFVGQSFSEVTGPCLSSDGSRLYFSSQTGPGPLGNLGVTYEVMGPFADPPGVMVEPCPRVPGLGALGGALLGAALSASAILALRSGRRTPSSGREA